MQRLFSVSQLKNKSHKRAAKQTTLWRDSIESKHLDTDFHSTYIDLFVAFKRLYGMILRFEVLVIALPVATTIPTLDVNSIKSWLSTLNPYCLEPGGPRLHWRGRGATGGINAPALTAFRKFVKVITGAAMEPLSMSEVDQILYGETYEFTEEDEKLVARTRIWDGMRRKQI